MLPKVTFVLSLHRVDLYANVSCRLDDLMAGALLALLVRSDNFVPSKILKRAWLLLMIAAPMAFLTEADCRLLYCAGVGSVHPRFDVLGAKMAPDGDDQPISGLHWDYQLRAVLAA